jgi:hypothetical protein
VDWRGLRPTLSAIPSVDPQPPRYNVPANYIPADVNWAQAVTNLNELRPDRGTYRLRVEQLEFTEGSLVQDEGRPGCVSYGQLRRFTITTTNARDASLTLHLSSASARGVAALYVGEGAPPTEAAYTAMAERASTARTPLRVTLSPCSVRTPTTWHVAVLLEPRDVAISRGVPPTTFTLSTHLESALLPRRDGAVVPRGADSPDVPARGSGGDGFVCCGVFKYFLVPTVPSHLSVRAELKVTKGVARALYVKAGTCPAFPDDVDFDECVGECALQWLTKFNPYDGAAISSSDARVVVPNGLGDGCPARCPPDLRKAGDWYVGVQALPGTSAEFELSTTLVAPEEHDPGHLCDPNEPECRPPIAAAVDTSGAAARRARPRAHDARLVLSALTALLLTAIAWNWSCTL